MEEKDQKLRVVCAQCGLADGIHEMDCKPPMVEAAIKTPDLIVGGSLSPA